MTQTTSYALSAAISPIPAPGTVKTVLDDAILVKVWSTPIPATDDSVITATPAASGSITVQFSADGANWLNAANTPYTTAYTGGVPPTTTYIRATATGGTATLAVSTPLQERFVAAQPTSWALATTGFSAPIVGQSGVALEALGRRQLVGALIGDSIEASYYNAGSSTTLFYLGEHSMITWLQRFSLGAVRISQNLAVTGTRLAAHILQIDLLNGSSRVIFENGGVNDIIGDDATVSYCLRQKALLWAKARSKGYEVVSVSVLPVAAAGGGSAAKNQKIVAFNEACDVLAAQYGVIRTNPYEVLIDPTDTNGYPLANMLWDGLHPGVMGAYYAGKRLWRDVSAAFPGILYLAASTVLDSYSAGTQNNVWSEGALFTGVGGTLNAQGGAGASGTVSSGYDVSAFGSATVVCSVISDPDGFGSALQLVISGAAANDRIEVRRIAITTTPAALNDTISSEYICRVTAGTTVGATVPWVLVQTNTGNNFAYGGSGQNSPNAYLTGGIPAEDVPYMIQVPPFTASNLTGTAVTLTALRDFVGIYMLGAGASTVVLSRKRCKKVISS